GRSGIGSGVTGRSRRAVCSNFANLTSVARLESVEGVMRSIFRIAVLVGVALTTPAQAQVKRAGDEEKPRIHRMEIYNNGVRTVRYFGSAGLSRGEDSVMRDLERAENEMSYIDVLQVVKSLYLASERILEPHRRIVQEQLYGLSSTTSGFAGASAFAP